jgi:hypothetical protein
MARSASSLPQAVHIFDAGQVLVQVLAFALQPHDFFLRAPAPIARFRHRVQFLQTFDGFLNGGHIRQQPAQPALVHIELGAANGFLGNGFLRLALGAHEQNNLALRCHIAYIPHGVFEQLQSLLQVNDINTIAFAKDVFFHLWIPALGLVPEMNACFEQFLHANRRQNSSFCQFLKPGSRSKAGFAARGC